MINFNNEKNMYDLFIDKEILTTQELLGAGFTNKDLTRLIESGKIKRVKRGFYELENTQGLFRYTQILFSKRYRNLDRAIKGLKRCIEIEPENGSIHSRMFLNAIVTEDYEQALKSFAVMDKTDNQFYKRDQNLWLYMLSFVTDLPDEYKDRVKNMKVVDLITIEKDKRYSDRLLQNKIRNAIFNHHFKEALELSKGKMPSSDKKLGSIITEKLLSKAIGVSVRDHEHLYDLISNCNYEEAAQLLLGAKELHGINPADEQFLVVLQDLIGIINEKKIPEVDTAKSISSFSDALMAHDYETLLKIYRSSSNRKFSKSSKFMGILLERVDSEISKLKLLCNNEEEVQKFVPEDSNKTSVNPDVDAMFTRIASSLLKQDVDTAFSLLEEYLSSINKSNFRGYVADLIKLSVLKKDTSFEEPILLLSTLSRDEFDFSVAAYIQDFYFNVARKNFKEAAIYLDILSMSEELGGVPIPTYDLREKLIGDAELAGITKEELGLKEKEVVVPQQVVPTVSSEELDEKVPVEETIESLMDIPYSITNAIDDILDDVNMIMLEPMSDEDIAKVVDAAVRVPKVQAITIKEASGEKRVVLRYYDKFGPYVNIGATLKAADEKYKNWEYQEAIDLYQSVMPKLEKPRSFIFARLGNCYRQTTYDGDYSKAIDYYTMAMAQSAEEDVPLDFTDLITDLKNKSKYNGKKIEMPIQYKKECN